MLLSVIILVNGTFHTFSNRGVQALRDIMGNQGMQNCRETKRQNIRFSSYFRSEFHTDSKRNLYSEQRNPFFKFTSAFELIELGISLPKIRVTKMLFLRLDQIIRF